MTEDELLGEYILDFVSGQTVSPVNITEVSRNELGDPSTLKDEAGAIYNWAAILRMRPPS